jgi:hypothetical protein
MADTSWMARFGARLVTNGYAILPIAPGTKKPGQFARAWHDYPQWNRHASRATTECEVATWSKWPDCGVGIVGGAVAALDIDIPRMPNWPCASSAGPRTAGRHARPAHRPGTEAAAGLSRAQPFAGSGARRWKCSASGSSSWPMPASRYRPPYAWPDEGLADLDIESLPAIDAEAAAAFLDEALALIPRRAAPKRLGSVVTSATDHPCAAACQAAPCPRSGARSPGCPMPSSTTTAGCASAWR